MLSVQRFLRSFNPAYSHPGISWAVEIVADVNLRDHFGLQDGNVVEIRVPTDGVRSR